MYLSLNAFSYVILGFGRFIREPLYCSFRGTLSTLRSTFFLAVFVALYQAVICVQRKVRIEIFEKKNFLTIIVFFFVRLLLEIIKVFIGLLVLLVLCQYLLKRKQEEKNLDYMFFQEQLIVFG